MRPLAWATPLLLVVAAGCAEPAAVPQAPAVEEPTGGGTILGFIVDAETAPVAGALVAIGEREPIVAGPDGRFAATGLEPGSHRVEVQALGYVPVAKTVEVDDFEPVRVTFTLNPIPVEVPYVELLIFKGYSQCDYMVWAVSGRLGPPCDTGQAKSRFPVHVKETWRFHVTEMSWRGGVGNYDSFRLFTSDDGDCANTSPCYGLVYGRGYARVEGEPGKTDLVKHYDPWMDLRGPPYPESGSFEMVVNGQWVGMFQSELNEPTVCQTVMRTGTGSGYKPGCLGVGVATGIPYDLYVSLFHSMEPEDRGACCPATKYTARPDG